ncbi:hypothetical protein LR48_Vigan647s000200 [Vigna angularis]|uniref:Uncharacterized protein n=1 Tax=Phaseolus angularis TaxID=3914 RepID=A0A0L9TFV5_PHAAN|nr:hypothetical protein LR48_Vigan647s000200 [Vigna angularis]
MGKAKKGPNFVVRKKIVTSKTIKRRARKKEYCALGVAPLRDASLGTPPALAHIEPQLRVTGAERTQLLGGAGQGGDFRWGEEGEDTHLMTPLEGNDHTHASIPNWRNTKMTQIEFLQSPNLNI